MTKLSHLEMKAHVENVLICQHLQKNLIKNERDGVRESPILNIFVFYPTKTHTIFI